MIKVCKFGGTSMADGVTISRVKQIVESDPSRRYVVVSAPGKRYGGDEKITDLFYQAHACLEQTGTCGEPFQKIKRRFMTIAETLGLKNFDAGFFLSETEREIVQNRNAEFTASRGEYLSALIFSAYLSIPFRDAADLFVIENGKLSEESYPRIARALNPLERAVIPGFYGRDRSGKICTLSRGGSDISGAAVSRAVQADCYENWTDVDGFLAADPRIVDSPARIRALTFSELKILSEMGAGVLHAASVGPVREAGIPVCVKDTFRPEEPGTRIISELPPGGSVTGIAGRRDFSLVTLKEFPREKLGRVFGFLKGEERLQINPSGVRLVLRRENFSAALSAFRGLCEEDCFIENFALIAVVGRGDCFFPARALKAAAQAGTEVLFFERSPSLILGVREEDFPCAVRALYDEFFRLEE